MRRISWSLIVVLSLLLLGSQPTTRAQELPAPDSVSQHLLSAESMGPHAFASIADDPSAGTVAWSNPTNAGASDDARAEAVMGGGATSHYLKATGPSFSIPTGATISGIEVKIEARASAGSHYGNMYLVKGGVIQTAGGPIIKAITGAGDTVYTYGGIGSTWSLGYTPADVNAADFGAAFSVLAGGAATLGVDAITVTVYYLPYRLLLPIVSR